MLLDSKSYKVFLEIKYLAWSFEDLSIENLWENKIITSVWKYTCKTLMIWVLGEEGSERDGIFCTSLVKSFVWLGGSGLRLYLGTEARALIFKM